jgi:hypothetical protein
VNPRAKPRTNVCIIAKNGSCGSGESGTTEKRTIWTYLQWQKELIAAAIFIATRLQDVIDAGCMSARMQRIDMYSQSEIDEVMELLTNSYPAFIDRAQYMSVSRRDHPELANRNMIELRKVVSNLPYFRRRVAELQKDILNVANGSFYTDQTFEYRGIQYKVSDWDLKRDPITNERPVDRLGEGLALEELSQLVCKTLSREIGRPRGPARNLILTLQFFRSLFFESHPIWIFNVPRYLAIVSIVLLAAGLVPSLLYLAWQTYRN